MGEKTRRQEVEAMLSEGPPMEWYYGYGYSNQGIQGVSYDDPLTTMGSGQVGESIKDWQHYVGNSKQGTDLSSPAWITHARLEIETAERIVLEATKYPMIAISKKREQLERMFKGKKHAPFRVELY